MLTGPVTGQDKVAKAGKANEVTHFKPLLEPLPLDGVVITSDAGHAGERPLADRRQARALHGPGAGYATWSGVRVRPLLSDGVRPDVTAGMGGVCALSCWSCPAVGGEWPAGRGVRLPR